MNDTTTDTPRIYVACLASYNAGILHGEWIDATDADEIREAIQTMPSESREPIAEEWTIHDFENFGTLTLSECEDIDKVAELGELIEEHGPAFAAYTNNVGIEHATADEFQDAFFGEHESERAYAEELFDDLNLADIPEHVRPYIDYDLFARDLFLSDYYSVTAPNGGVYVFTH